MSYQGHEDGLYLVKQPSQKLGVDHYGIVDIGNRMRLSGCDRSHPVVVHQTPPRIRFDWLQNTEKWRVLGKITDEKSALIRIREAHRNPAYDLFGHNCEHFARYIATGKKESFQLQAGFFWAGLATLVVLDSDLGKEFD